MGRGFQGTVALDEHGHVEKLGGDDLDDVEKRKRASDSSDQGKLPPIAASYMEVFSDRRSFVLCVSGFFFQ